MVKIPKLSANLDIGKLKVLAGRTAAAMRENVIVAAVEPYGDLLQELTPQAIQTFIDNNTILVEVLSAEHRSNPMVSTLLTMDTAVLLKVLKKFNPAAARVLDTEAGIAWWARQVESVV